MKKVALIGGLLALLGAGSAYALGQFPDYPLATGSLTGNERIPADTMLGQGINPQTEVISTTQLKAYVLTSPTITGVLTLPIYTIANATTACTASTVNSLMLVSDGTAYATGTYGSAVGATGAVKRVVLCTAAATLVYN